MNRRESAIASALRAALEEDPGSIALRRAGGGCINSAALVETASGTWFVKWNDRPLPHQFAAEAAGLRALRAAETDLVVPRPLASSDDPGEAFLLLEYLPRGSRSRDFDERLGRALAALHRTTSPSGFGFEMDGCCGATPQPNGWMPSWRAFFAERRLGHQLALARRRGFDGSSARAVERLIERLDAWIDDDEPSALVHGDLWSGNLHVAASGAPALIDPAAYFGHREAELGMMTLFGGFSARVFAAYDEAWPLLAGWRERIELYALYHVLNHYNLFGGGYGSQAVAIARRFAGG